MTDIVYSENGMFVRFYPNSKEGETAWQEMANEMDGVPAVLPFEARKVIYQLRRAGYSVAKMPVCDMSVQEILQELRD